MRDPQADDDDEMDVEDDGLWSDPNEVPEDDDDPPDNEEPTARLQALKQRAAVMASQDDDDEEEEEEEEDEEKESLPQNDLEMIDGPEPESDEEPGPTLPPRQPEGGRLVRYGDLVLEYKHWTNPRSVTGLDDASLAALASSIKAETTTTEDAMFVGLLDNMKVVPISANGGVVNLVIDGQRRHRAIAVAGLGDDALVPVTYLEDAPVEWTREIATKYLFSAVEGVGTREGLSAFELAENAERLRKEKDPDTGLEYTMSKIARAIGRSDSWVSKMLTARKAATPRLLHQWKLGEITDEQFRDLARAKGEEQDAKADVVAETRKSQGRGAARALAKETKVKAVLAAQPEKPRVKPESEKRSKKASGPVVRGPQQEIPAVTPKRTPPSFAVVEETLSKADAHPPTHDYVKGIMDGARWAVGMMDPAGFAKAWHTYLERTGPRREKAPPKKAPEKKAKKK